MLSIKAFQSYNYGLYLVLFFLIVLLTPGAQAQNSLQLSLDVAQFQNSAQKPYLEIYYGLAEGTIEYVPNAEGKYCSQVVMDLMIYKADSLWATKVWKFEKTLEDTIQLDENKQMVDMFRYFLDGPETYRVVIHARDLNRKGDIDSVVTEIKCREFLSEAMQLSDVQLASQIKKVSDSSSKVFYKRNYEVLPNPTLIYGEGAPVLYYYFEAYNLLKNVPSEKYKCLAFLKDSNGKVVEGLGSPSRTKKKMYDHSVEMGMINISTLPTGQYFFVYGITDAAGVELSRKEKRFFVYNPSVPIASAAQVGINMGTRVADLGGLEAMTQKELDVEFERMQYLTEKEHREFYKNLTNPEAKKQFVSSIWQSKTSDEGLTGMNYRQLYLSRVREANARYKATGRDGWKTDQGRVFILYGQPTNIERFPSTPANKPYQIWTYDNLRGQGGVIFVFADRFGFNRYELLHSTLRGELQDPFWQRYILIGPQQEIQPQ